MTFTDRTSDRTSDSAGEPFFSELEEYQAVSRLAVGSLVVGVLSALALLGPLLWMVPLFAIVLGLLALVVIKRSRGGLVGVPMALAGLCLAICFGSAGLADYFNARRIVARQAQEVAEQWFAALARNQPELACEWQAGLGSRAPVDELGQLPGFYESHEKQNEALTKFVVGKPIALLLALGRRAHARLVSTTSIDEALEYISQIYEVTYQDDAGKPRQFLMVLALERRTILLNPSPWWRVASWSPLGDLPPGPGK